VGDYTIVERCSDCGAHIEEYTDEEIGIFIVILGTFIHREPAMAAPFLPEILTMTSRYVGLLTRIFSRLNLSLFQHLFKQHPCLAR